MFNADIVAILSDHNDECEACDEPGDLICCDFCNMVLLHFLSVCMNMLVSSVSINIMSQHNNYYPMITWTIHLLVRCGLLKLFCITSIFLGVALKVS